jgi:hypothetical protein
MSPLIVKEYLVVRCHLKLPVACRFNVSPRCVLKPVTTIEFISRFAAPSLTRREIVGQLREAECRPSHDVLNILFIGFFPPFECNPTTVVVSAIFPQQEPQKTVRYQEGFPPAIKSFASRKSSDKILIDSTPDYGSS